MESVFQRVNCSQCRLSRLCFSYGLDREEADDLEKIVRCKRTLKPDDYLFRQEDLSASLFVVKSGSFRSFIWDTDGSEQTIGFYLPGELIGLDALQQNKRHYCTVVALETASVCDLPVSRLNDLCAKIPALRSRYMNMIGAQIVSGQNDRVLFGKRSATEKVAMFLWVLSRRFYALGYSGRQFNLSMTRLDIANYLGLSLETVSRQLSYLTKTGVVSVKHRGVQINNMNSLKTIVESCCNRQLT